MTGLIDEWRKLTATEGMPPMVPGLPGTSTPVHDLEAVAVGEVR
jgi:hypothetical protein